MNRTSASIATLAVVLSVVYIAFSKLTPYYMANDDVAIRTIVEGTYQDVPDAYRHLVLFTHALLGKLLVLLYDRLPGVIWYDAVHLALNLLALAAIGLCLFRAVDRWYSVLALYALLIAWGLVFFVSPQFTMTAALQGVAAIVLVVTSTLRDRRSTAPLFAAFFFAAAGYLVRGNALLLTLVAGAGCAVPLFNRVSLRRFAPVVALAAAFVVFAWLAERYDRHVYATTPGFEDVKTLNLLRAEWQELSLDPAYNTAENRAAIERVLETTPLDAVRMDLMRDWVIADSRVNVENLRATLEAIRPYVSKSGNPLITLNEFERTVFYVVEEGIRYLLLVLLGCLLWPGRPALTMAAWSLAVFGCLFTLLFVAYKMPPLRVYYPLLFVAGVMVVLAGTRGGAGHSSHESSSQGALALFIVATVCAAQLGMLRERSFHYWPYYRSARHDVQALDQAYRYVTFGAVLPVTRLVFPFKPNAVLDELNVVRAGWTSLLPYMRERLYTGSPDGTVVDLVCSPKTRILARREKSDFLGAIEHYGARVLGRNVWFERTNATTAFEVFRCREDALSVETQAVPDSDYGERRRNLPD